MISSPTYTRSIQAGWTFVEMLVAVAIASVCLAAGAMALQSVSANAKRTTSIVELDIGEATNLAFYGQSGSKIRTYMAPNFGKIAFVQELRDRLADDAQRSTAVFCLPRSVPNTIHPETLTLPGGGTQRPDLDSSEDFRSFLATIEPTSAGIFDTAFRNVPPTSKPSVSIFLLGPSSQSDEIYVNAIYEIDFVIPSNGSKANGIYASVRRHVGTALTHYYDIYFEQGDGDPFHPVFVEFEQVSRLAGGESADIQKFQIAPRSPFYLLWLPDPSINPYKKPAWTPVDDASLARSTYEHMSGRSAFTIVLPMFPSL